MTPEKRARLIELQQRLDFGDVVAGGVRRGPLSKGEQAELDALRRELAASPELPDNPATPFVDESRRPNLDGTDYNDTLHAMRCAEAGEVLAALLAKVGAVAFDVAVAALKR